FLQSLTRVALTDTEKEGYERIAVLMDQAFENYRGLFAQRAAEKHVKRCHGDLKVTNLWVRPAQLSADNSQVVPQQLLALDCVDFNPTFCYIDTLSDVAMLAIDIEMHLIYESENKEHLQLRQELVDYFLDTYLHLAQEESETVWPLIEYY